MMTSADILMTVQTHFIGLHAHFLLWEQRSCQFPEDEIILRIRNEYAKRSSEMRLLLRKLFSQDDIDEMIIQAIALSAKL